MNPVLRLVLSLSLGGSLMALLVLGLKWTLRGKLPSAFYYCAWLAVLLRLDAVQFDEYNKPFVYMASGEDEPAKVPVTVGMSDGITCEITSGLSAGDTVLKPSGMSMKELMEMARQSRTSRN